MMSNLQCYDFQYRNVKVHPNLHSFIPILFSILMLTMWYMHTFNLILLILLVTYYDLQHPARVVHNLNSHPSAVQLRSERVKNTLLRFEYLPKVF